MITFVIGKEKNMSTILFGEIVFGPIHSRRLGVSLGINLLPDDGKVYLLIVFIVSVVIMRTNEVKKDYLLVKLCMMH